MTLDKKSREFTPLLVISLFLGLSEAVLGIGAIQTEGGIQIALVSFAVSFPVLVAAGFFAILWHRPHVFYPPSAYSNVDVRHFVDAVSGSSNPDNDLSEIIREEVRSSIVDSELISKLLDSTGGSDDNSDLHAEVRDLLEEAVDHASERILEKGFVTVDVSNILGRSVVWQEAVSEYQTVSNFLDSLWGRINQSKSGSVVPAFTYGTRWALRDLGTGRVIPDLGSQWANKHGLPSDSRSLSVVGILPGGKLEAIFLK